MTLLPILLSPKQIGNLIPPKRYIIMGESVFLDKYWKFSTINTVSILSNMFISLSKVHTSPPKKTLQSYTNLKNCLDLCQKHWNQSKYWKCSPMYQTITKTAQFCFNSKITQKWWQHKHVWTFNLQNLNIHVYYKNDLIKQPRPHYSVTYFHSFWSYIRHTLLMDQRDQSIHQF